jgi:hypothetical protein
VITEGRFQADRKHGCWLETQPQESPRSGIAAIGTYWRGRKDGNWLYTDADGRQWMRGWSAGTLGSVKTE